MSRLSEIESFIAVAQSGSITGGALKLGVAKSAVSRRLSDLEARLGVQLIQRTTRQSRLTEEGARYLENTTAALDALDAAEDALHEQQCNLSGTLRVTAPVSYALTRLQPIFAKFMTDHPDVDLFADFSDRRVDLVQDGFDLAIRIGEMTDSSLIASKVASVRHRCVASPAFWQQYGLPKTALDLEKLPFLRYHNLRQRGTVNFTDPNGTKGKIKPHQRASASNGDFLAQMALNDLGFLIEPDFISDHLIATGQLQEVLMDYDWYHMDLFAVFPATRRKTRRAEMFVKYLKEGLHRE